MEKADSVIQTDKLAVRPSEAARLIGVSKTTMHRMIGAGDVKTSQPTGPGGALLVHVASLRRLLRRTEVSV